MAPMLPLFEALAATTTQSCSTPGPAACCAWRSHMAEPAAASGARVPLHRGNVAVVIPALNEALRIREVVLDALAHCDHVIVVDDGSDDHTAGRNADLDATVSSEEQTSELQSLMRTPYAV